MIGDEPFKFLGCFILLATLLDQCVAALRGWDEYGGHFDWRLCIGVIILAALSGGFLLLGFAWYGTAYERWDVIGAGVFVLTGALIGAFIGGLIGFGETYDWGEVWRRVVQLAVAGLVAGFLLLVPSCALYVYLGGGWWGCLAAAAVCSGVWVACKVAGAPLLD